MQIARAPFNDIFLNIIIYISFFILYTSGILGGFCFATRHDKNTDDNIINCARSLENFEINKTYMFSHYT